MTKKHMTITRSVWEALWEELAAGAKQRSLNEYAHFVDARKAEWARAYGAWNYSNGRYVCHVEEALSRGFKQPGPVSLDDIRYDAPAFPFVRAAIARATGKETA